jgi:hypothetical protein
MKKELKNFIYKVNNTDYKRCLAPSGNCDNAPTGAHSIQNSRIFDLLQKNGHLVSFKIVPSSEIGPYLDFDEKVGRNQASTFQGLCNKHDTEIFREIENQNLDLQNNSKQLFLFSYRAILREMHAVTLTALRTQNTYKKQVELGLLPKNEPSAFGLWATDWVSNAYLMSIYKNKYDEVYLSKSFKDIHHDLIILKDQSPTIAVSSLFSLDHIKVQDDIARVALSIFPKNKSETIVLFSYLKFEAPKAREEIKEIFFAGPLLKRKLISRLVLQNCENFFIAPDYFESWSKSKRRLVKDYYNETLHGQNFEIESSEILLF